MNLAEIVSRHAAATPHAPAVIERERTWSYLEFDRAIRRAAHALRARGIAPGDVVGLAMRSSALHLVAAYALARLGAVQLVLRHLDPAPVRAQLAARFGARHVLGDVRGLRIEGLEFHRADPAWLDPAGAVPEQAAAPGGDAPWKIVMSSGTTAAPKAVLQSHAMHIAWREIYAKAIRVLPEDRLLVMIELDYYIGLRQCMEMHWSGACTIVGAEVLTLIQLVEAVKRYKVNSLHLLPTYLEPAVARAPVDRVLFPEVRVLRTGAMVVSERLSSAIRRRLTPNLVITYGTNDLGPLLTCADAATQERFPGSVGIAPPGVQLEIVDERDRALPAGETGLIRARVPGMPSGYIDNPEATAQAFRGGWYYPGDLGWTSAEGVLYFKGRADDLMNFDGTKIYPADIEAVLAAHPAVAEVAAFPVASAAHQDVPAAAVVLRAPASLDTLTEWCREKLGSRAPAKIAIVPALPRNATGKVLKRELAKTFQRVHRDRDA